MRRGRAETELSDVPDVVVETVAGRVRGRSVHGVARFLGVPFAAGGPTDVVARILS